MRRAMTAAVSVAALILLGSSAPAIADSVGAGPGGYLLRAQAAPVSVLLYEDGLPSVSDGPQGEVDLCYTRAKLDAGPTSRALSSMVWPGDLVGDGLGTITGGASGGKGQEYPVRSVSQYPEGPEADGKDVSGNGMTTKSGPAGAEAHVRGSASRAGNREPLPPAAIPEDSGALVRAAAVSSMSKVGNPGDGVIAAASTAASDIALLSGLITIETVSVSSSAISDGHRARTSGSATVTGVSVAGQALKIDQRGVRLPTGHEFDSDGLPAPVAKELEAQGLSFGTVEVTRKVSGAQARQEVQSLVITVNTDRLRKAIESPTGQLRDALPPEVEAQLAPLLDLSPKIVFTLGTVTSSAGAASSDRSIPPGTTPIAVGGTGTGQAPTSGVQAGGSSGSAPTPADAVPAPAPIGEPPPQTLAARPAASLGGVPFSVIAIGLIIAAGIGWALRQAGVAMLGGAAACDLGVVQRVPHLREG